MESYALCIPYDLEIALIPISLVPTVDKIIRKPITMSIDISIMWPCNSVAMEIRDTTTL